MNTPVQKLTRIELGLDEDTITSIPRGSEFYDGERHMAATHQCSLRFLSGLRKYDSGGMGGTLSLSNTLQPLFCTLIPCRKVLQFGDWVYEKAN